MPKYSAEAFRMQMLKYAGASLIIYIVAVGMLLMTGGRTTIISDKPAVETQKEEVSVTETIDVWSLRKDDGKVHTFRNSEAVYATLKYGDYNQLIAGNNYTCIKYNEGNYDYLIVHYFDSTGYLKSWHKIVFATDSSNAKSIAAKEREADYIATVKNNIVVITSRDADNNMSYESYVDCFENRIFVNESY